MGRLIHFLPFLEEVIKADHWAVEVICHTYPIRLFQTLPNIGDQECPTSILWTTYMV